MPVNRDRPGNKVVLFAVEDSACTSPPLLVVQLLFNRLSFWPVGIGILVR